MPKNNNKNEYKKLNRANNQIKSMSKHKMKYFLRGAFSILNPSIKLSWNWHLDYLCDTLEEVFNGKIKRLLINIPPRYLKSVICSVCFPAWVLGKDATKRIIVASYSKQLSTKHSTDTRQIMMSNWYKKCFPETIIADGMNEKNKFCTTKNGFRFATSVNGTLTGEGGDILIADDPHNPVNIYSKQSRQKTIDWFSGVFSSRLNNKNEGSIIVIMQRLHTDDLSGYLISHNVKQEWFCINLPAIAEDETSYYLFDKLYKIRKIGNILHQKMENQHTLENVKAELGEYNFMAQYQQTPISVDGNMIKKSWLHYFDLKDIVNLYNKNDIKYYISIDCASGIGTENDFTAVSVFVVENEKFYLCEVIRLKIPYPELKAKVGKIIEKYNPKAVLIEDKSNGSSLIQELQQNHYNIIPIKPTKSKECRVNDILIVLENGYLLIAKNQYWNQEFEAELLSFPAGKHDDQVDSVSQFINWYNNNRKKVNIKPKIRGL